MITDLKLYGPIEIECKIDRAVKYIDNAEKKNFLIDLDDADLSMKQGCYVFAIRAGRGFCPWYVGKATKSFRQECMTSHKLHNYNAVLSGGRKGTPVMFFVCPDGNKNKVSKKVCDEMESTLIQAALYQNLDLRNIQKKKLRVWGISGVLYSKKGKPSKSASAFRTMMGL